jgi:gamma-glutamylcyclotransferase (GGCT)/AIG2-like uncharacterized protein YtfP
MATIFVYGTLKRGCRNHDVMRDAELMCEAATEHAYLMVNCGSYPGLVRPRVGQPGLAIRGELYRVNDELLAALDRFEDVPREYVRETIRLDDGTEAQTYFYVLSTEGLEMLGEEWIEVEP